MYRGSPGNLNKPKKAKILIVNENGETIEEHPIADFNGATEIQAKISPRLSSGTYHVYLQLFGDMLNGEPRYTVQFANNGIEPITHVILNIFERRPAVINCFRSCAFGAYRRMIPFFDDLIVPFQIEVTQMNAVHFGKTGIDIAADRHASATRAGAARAGAHA